MPRQLPLTVPGLALMAILGCATYHPLPLDRQAERRALAPPDMRAVTVEAARIRHPLLEPVHLDLAQGLTPDQAAVVAVLTNPQLRVARDQRGLVQAQVIQAGLLPNPVASYRQDIPTGGNDRGKVTGYDTQLGFDLTSLLTYALRREAAGAQAQAVDLDIAWQEWQVAQAVRMAAFHILALREELPLARSVEREARRTATAMTSAVRTGAVSGGEEAAANSRWQQTRDGVLLLEQEEGRQGRTLKALLGLPPGEPLVLRADASLPEWPTLPSQEVLIEGLGERRLDLLALKKGYESQDDRLRIAIRSQFPDIGIDLSHARDTDNVVTTGYGVAIQLPLFDRGQGRVAYASATRQQLHDDFAARLFAARADVAQILADLATVRERLQTAHAVLPSLQVVAEAYEKATASGAVDLVAAQAARAAYLSQAMAVVRLRAEQADLGLALEVASGCYMPGDPMSPAGAAAGGTPPHSGDPR